MKKLKVYSGFSYYSPKNKKRILVRTLVATYSRKEAAKLLDTSVYDVTTYYHLIPNPSGPMKIVIENPFLIFIASDAQKDDYKPRPIKRSNLSTIRMAAGNENYIDKVIDEEGNLKDWVAIGWIDCGPASEQDKLKYPVIED